MAGFGPIWQALIHTAVAAVLSYFVLIILIRAFGQRTLAKWNAFGFMVTIALGSAMATGILSARVSFLQSSLAFALLLSLQLMFATIYTRCLAFGHIQPSTRAYPSSRQIHRFKNEETPDCGAGYPRRRPLAGDRSHRRR
jgi:hypothetical protein